jgi:hypothetical protein
MSTKSDKINIKLEVCKLKDSNGLQILARFRDDAPNFFKDADGYYWIPTIEERDFINEAFNLVLGRYGQHHEKTKTEQPKEESFIEESKSSGEQKKESVGSSSQGQKKKSPAEQSSKTKQDEDVIFEVADKESSGSNETDETRVDEKSKVDIVKADDHAINEALKKHRGLNDVMVEVDEQTIIDKVLSQKKKGKWG